MAHSQAIHIITIAKEPSYYFDELLSMCIAYPGPGRLDVAIDILSMTGDCLRDYAWSAFARDVSEWEPWFEEAYKPNDDYWYILLRSVAKSTIQVDFRLLFVRSLKQAESRGIREGVVDALQDIGNEDSVLLLRSFADEDEDPFIRKLALEAIEDLEN